MVKCQSCSEGRCRKKYENRHLCDKPSRCTCTCQEKPSSTFWKAAGSIAMGVGAFAGGVVLTVSTGGLGLVGIAAVAGGGALTGVGATAAIHPIAKKISGERMTGADYAKDLALGASVGAITGPIGAGGASATTSIAAKVGTEGVKQGAVKLACRTVVGAASGAVGSTIQETVNATSKGGSFSFTNVVKGAALGAATGGVGHLSSNVGNVMPSAATRSVAKVVTDTAGAVAIDATSQIITEGEIDGKRLALNAGARAATSAGQEAVANAAYNKFKAPKVKAAKELARDKQDDKAKLDAMNDTDREAAVKAKKFLEKVLTPDQAEKELLLATESSTAKKVLRVLEGNRDHTETELRNVNEKMGQVKQDPSLSPEDRRIEMTKLQADKELLLKQIKNLNKEIGKHQKEVLPNVKEPTKMGDQNIHALDSNRLGQFAADLPDVDGSITDRGERRVVYDLKTDKGGKNLRFKISGIVENHDYSIETGPPAYGQSDQNKVYVEVYEPDPLVENKPFVFPDNEKKEKKKKKEE